MFSLIITIIAIALVAALALASIYYGGSAFNKGSEKAQASTLVNNAQQVAAAMTLADTDGVTYSAGISDGVADNNDLVDQNYLSTAPADLAISTGGNVTATVVSAEVCAAVNAQSGYTMADPAPTTPALAEAAIVGESQFGCDADGTSHTFAFKH